MEVNGAEYPSVILEEKPPSGDWWPEGNVVMVYRRDGKTLQTELGTLKQRSNGARMLVCREIKEA